VRIAAHTGRLDEAEAAAHEQFELAQRLFGKQSMRYVQALGTLQSVANERGNTSDALRLQTEIMNAREQMLPEQHPQIARNHFNFAQLAQDAGGPKAAEMHFRKAIDIAERVWLPSDVNRLLFPVAYGTFLVHQSRVGEAATIARSVLANIEAHPELKEFDVYDLVLFMISLGEYGADHTPARRKAAAAAFQLAREHAEGRSTKRAVERLGETMQKMGVLRESELMPPK
jgi:hypothetical protein